MNIVSATITGSLVLNGVNISSITGSESSIAALNSFTASAATTGSNQFNGNQTVTGSLNITGSLIVTGSIIGTVTTASYVLNAVSASYALNATTASYALISSTSSFADTFTVAGTLTAQKLVVQTITSSIVYSSGSNVFGNSVSNTQSMTGSVGISGSLEVVGAGTFTGTVTATTGTTGTAIKLGGVTNYGLIQDANSVSRIWFENTGSYRTIFDLPSSGTSFVFRDYSGNIGASISSAGAATFSSSVTATSFIVGEMQITSNQIYRNSASEMYVNYSGTGNTILGNASGNVSINAGTNPAYRLHVGGTLGVTGAATFSGNVTIDKATPLFVLQASDSATFHGIEFRQAAGFDAFIKQLPSTGEFRISNGRSVGWGGFQTFYTDTVERMRITPGGNVLIGTTTADALLEVKQPTLAIGNIFQAWSPGVAGATFKVISTTGQPYMQYDFNNGNVGIGTTNPLGKLTTFGGAVQFIGDYNNHHTIVKSTGNQGTFDGSLVITIPAMSTAAADGYGGYSCEVYVAGFNGMYCHVWFSGYINGGITGSEAAILRSNGGWSVSQASSGTNNQGFTFTIDYPAGLIHPTARIIFNKGGNLSATAYPANSITAVWS